MYRWIVAIAALTLIPLAAMDTAQAQTSQSVVPQVTVPSTTGAITGATSGAVADSFSAQKIDAFVTAMVSVDQLIKRWLPRIGEAANEQQRQALTRQADSELLAAIDHTKGISVAEYQQMGRVVETDQAFAARVHQLYVARRGN